jgi:hypothetical protein
MSIYDKASLVLIPSGTKTSKVYSQKPVNGDGDFTFSRSTAATRVNADGNIEKETQNLLLQSNDFDTTWTLYNVTATSGQSGYDGSSDAWQISTTGVNGFENLNQNISFSGVHTISMYAKAGSNVYLTMRSLGTDIRVQFKLDDGTHSTTFGSPIDTFMQDVGSGWYRCGFTANFSSASEWVFYPQRIAVVDAGNIYIQDAQLNQGLIAQEVITTTTTALYGGITDNVPRLDYTDSSCPALLLEPSRTNIIDQSEYFGAWNKSVLGISSVVSNYAISPEGVQNAAQVNFIVQGDSDIALFKFHPVTGGSTYAYSIYIKGEGSDIGKDIVVKSKRSGGDSAGTTTIQTLTGEWQRVDFTTTYAANNTAANFYLSSNDATSVLVYGAQVELGSYATSYIPTYGTSVTRNVDSCTKTGISSLIGQTEGTMFLEMSALEDDGTDRKISIRMEQMTIW